MPEEKSRIDSFDVSLGPTSAKSPAPKQLEKWNILVCSDLGFVSKEPVSVHRSDWNDFMGSQNILISGTVENRLTKDGKPLFVECRVGSIKDFSLENIMLRLSPLSAYAKTVFALQQLCEGKTSRGDATSAIKKAQLPQQEEAQVMALLDSQPAGRSSGQTQTAGGSTVDKILSMIDVSPQTGTENVRESASFSKSAVDALSEAASGSGEQPLRKSDISNYVKNCRQRLDSQVVAILSQDFFASRKSSWNCLKRLCDAIGRNRQLSVNVFSCPAQDMEEKLPAVLASCMEAGAAPDLVVWDFYVTFTNADMDRMAKLGASCETYKSVAVAALAMEDPLFAGLSGRDDVSHLFGEVRFLPLKKLRTESASRCLCLAGPGLASGETIAAGNEEVSGFKGRCCWFIATRWAELLCTDSNPFYVKESRPPFESVFSSGPVFCMNVPSSVAGQAEAMGLTLFENALEKAGLDRARTLIDKEKAAASYSVLLFNLLVNRMIRLCGIKILGCGPEKNRDDVAGVLCEFVRRELAAYGAISSQEQVTVLADAGGAINVDVNSDVTISGQPVRFSFSF